MTKDFENKLKNYRIHLLVIKEIKLENNFGLEIMAMNSDGEEEKIPSQGKSDDNILRTKIFAIFSEAYLKNHALLTDSKVTLGIPFLEINISDNLFTLLEIIKSLNILEEYLSPILKPESESKETTKPAKGSESPYKRGAIKQPEDLHKNIPKPQLSGG
jgi:hypothetical protein